MPNWVQNEIAIKGKSADLVKFINDGLKGSFKYCRNKLQITELNQETIDQINNLSGKRRLSFASYVPMPKTFIKWDTTNQKCKFDDWIERGKSTNFGNYDKELFQKIRAYFEENKEKWVAIAKEKYADIVKWDSEYERYAEHLAAADMFPNEYEEYLKVYSEPYDNAVAEQKQKYGVVGWYDWRRKNYGTKWDADFDNITLVHLLDDYAILYVSMETAWSMPLSWLNTMLQRYDNLRFVLYATEESDAFGGFYDIKGDYCEDIDFDSIYNKYKGKEDETEEEEQQRYNDICDEVNGEKSRVYDNFVKYMESVEI